MTDGFWRRNVILLISIFLLTVALGISVFQIAQEMSNRPPDPICVAGHYEERSNFIYINGTLIPIYDHAFVCDVWEKK